MANGNRIDPYLGYMFSVSIGAITNIGFRECMGLSLEVAPVEYREGNSRNLNVRKLYGLRTFQNLQFKRGIIEDRQLYLWYLEALNGNAPRRDGSITLLGQDGEPTGWHWLFFEAFPTKWEGPSLNATANEVAIEALDIAVERIEAQV